MNKRRTLLVTLATGVLLAPFTSFAQQQKKLHRIGILVSDSLETRGPSVEIFIRAMRDFGYIEGRNIVYEPRYAGGDTARLSAFAAELAGQNLDVIVVPNDFTLQFAARAVEEAKRPVPIVFAGSSAPVRAGGVTSFGRPGGNITGITNIAHELAGKQLQLLNDLGPKISRVAVFLDFVNARLAPLYLAEVERSAKALGMQTLILEVKSSEDVERNVALMRKWRADSVFVATQSANSSNRKLLVQIAEIARLPAIYGSDVYTDIGGLMSYGSSNGLLWRQTATFVDKILKGARAGDLPIEIPSKFELVINLKTARALGITLPRSVLARADRVIE